MSEQVAERRRASGPRPRSPRRARTARRGSSSCRRASAGAGVRPARLEEAHRDEQRSVGWMLADRAIAARSPVRSRGECALPCERARRLPVCDHTAAIASAPARRPPARAGRARGPGCPTSSAQERAARPRAANARAQPRSAQRRRRRRRRTRRRRVRAGTPSPRRAASRPSSRRGTGPAACERRARDRLRDVAEPVLGEHLRTSRLSGNENSSYGLPML